MTNKISTENIIRKLDDYLNKNDYTGAEKHLKLWFAEAENKNELNVMVTVLNEQIGLYRKTQNESECFKAVNKAFEVCGELELKGTVTMGTTYLNAATAYKAFGKPKDAIELYEKAYKIYKENLTDSDSRLSGLYNNMAITLYSLGEFERAKAMFFDAIKIKENIKNGKADIAVTYCNLADCIEAEKGLIDGQTEIETYLNKAMENLNSTELARNGYYAFVCEKCAPVFGYYGYFAYEKELIKRMEEIYAGA